MIETTLDTDEIRELKEKFPTEIINAQYALQLLEKHAKEVSAEYEENALFPYLIDGLTRLSNCIAEGYGYINQYLDYRKSTPTRGTVSLLARNGPISISDLNECLRDLSETLEGDLDDWPSISRGLKVLSPRRTERLEQELESVWERVREVGYKTHGILIGIDFGPHELIFCVRTETAAPSAIQEPQMAADGLDRALVVALSDRADPNKRCAAVTIALALTVCPDRVQLQPAGIVHDLTARFESIELCFFGTSEEVDLRWGNAIKHRNACGAIEYEQLPNLAEVYEDHTRNMDCLRDLREYFPIAHDQVSRAAVLGLAWARLQRLNVSTGYRIDRYGESGGHFIECSQLGVGIRLAGGAGKHPIAGAWYPGITTGAESAVLSDEPVEAPQHSRDECLRDEDADFGDDDQPFR
jgi:hypothetical protein